MSLKLYTATFNYRGQDRFDITVKTKEHPEFCPTWEMVAGYKNGSMSEEEYTRLYHELMVESWRKYNKAWRDLLALNEATLVCFCKKNTFCHRYLLAQYLVKCGVEYIGDR